MWELRWILIGLGAALLVGLYLWGRSGFKFRRGSAKALTGDSGSASADTEAPRELEPATGEESAEEGSAASAHRPMNGPERVIALRLVPRDKELDAELAVASLRDAGMQHGRYGIFHSQAKWSGQAETFSVASLVEPGSFDLENLKDSTIPGMSFFMLLPGLGDPVSRFDAMVETARSIALELNAELFDDRGSSWSIQRERYIREELIHYRHQYCRS
jgi:cell division protein ZipA